ncbi:Vacuolar protein sorting-associated protein 53-like protein [Smittium mucronatum]|uniref:Vacuolar protein sorting-associated protein 53-like protein n=1 Tax=Smittium mucronatum TaxID=133383 RepID=A0A1R0H5J6_9FUNG|nr:Vacuolar protein sorting-associated protein 53-like protein [Smittium mucronatum]
MIHNQLKYSENIDFDKMMDALSETLIFENQLDKRFESRKKSESYENKYFKEKNISFSTFKGSISSSFEPYLPHYIKSIEKKFSGLIEKYKTTESNSSIDDKSDELVLPSIVDLLYCYREALSKVVTLTTGKPLYELAIVFDKMMAKYSSTLLNPKIMRNNNIIKPITSDLEFSCLITNTADYCASSINQLEEKMLEKIDPDLRSKINFDSCQSTLIKELINAYMNSLSSQSQINEVGAEQLLLDFHPIKSIILNLPILKMEQIPGKEESKISKKSISSYVQIVTAKLNRVESILKVLLVPVNSPEVLISQFLLLFPEGPVDVFKQILSFKGVNGSNQQRLFMDLLVDNTAEPYASDDMSLISGPEYLDSEVLGGRMPRINAMGSDRAKSYGDLDINENIDLNSVKTRLMEKSNTLTLPTSPNTPSSNWLNFTGMYSSLTKPNDPFRSPLSSKDDFSTTSNNRNQTAPTKSHKPISPQSTQNEPPSVNADSSLNSSEIKPFQNGKIQSHISDSLINSNLGSSNFSKDTTSSLRRGSLSTFNRPRFGHSPLGVKTLDIDIKSRNPSDTSGPRTADILDSKSPDQLKSFENTGPFSPILSGISATTSATKTKFSDNFKRMVSNITFKKDDHS